MKNWLKTTVGLSMSLAFVLIANGARAETDEEVIKELQAQLAVLSARLEKLESRKQVPDSDYQIPSTAPVAAATPGWEDRIRLKGDFRYRHESIDAEFADKDRHRQRIRARPAIEADVSDNLEVGFGLATGSDDPVSSNQTLGDGFSSKVINLDLAYFDWSTGVDGLHVVGGKFKNPVHRAGGNGLIWDSDLRPEGISAQYRRGGLNAVAMGLWINESSAGKDQFVFTGQVDWSMDLGRTANLLLGTGYYDFSGLKGQDVPFDGDPRGNTVDASNQYVYGYQELELLTELTLNIADQPVKLFANYVKNLDGGEFDTGWAVGGRLDFKHGIRPWSLGYTYEDLEADAVFAIFTDSDFIGGGTDGKGHILRGKYALSKTIALGGTLFINERGGNNGLAEDYNRLMLDIEFKY